MTTFELDYEKINVETSIMLIKLRFILSNLSSFSIKPDILLKNEYIRLSSIILYWHLLHVYEVAK